MRNYLIPIIIFLSVEALFGQVEYNSWRERYFQGVPLQIGNKVQFLFDDFIVEDKYGLRRTVGPIEKYSGNPLIIGTDKPWELSSSTWGGTILRHIIFDPEEKVFKGWYVIYRREPGIETGYNYSTLYAESKDGINWQKPDLDFFLVDGRKTNIVIHKEIGTALLEEVMLDSSAKDRNCRYIGLVKMIPPGENTRCIVQMLSPDGKKWTLAQNPVLFRGASDGSYSLVYDDEKNRWIIYRRPPTYAIVNNKDDGFYVDRNTKRRVSVTLSKDFKNWTYPRNLVVLDELDDSKIIQTGNKMDIDWATVVRYEGIFLGFLSLMDNLTISIPRSNQLMWSRDGFDWERLPERPTFIKNGDPGEWDAGSIGSISLIPDGERIRIYYSGGNTPQGFYGREGEKDLPRFSGTGLAFIGKDRFIGLQAGPEGGFLLTKQFIFEGNNLTINFQSHVKTPPPVLGSMIKAELLQPATDHTMAMPYPGFAIEDCDPITTKDSFNKTVTWKGKSLSKLKGKPVYIRFYLRNVTLYTFKIENYSG